MADKAPAFDFEQMTVEELTVVINAAEMNRREKLEEARKALIVEFQQKASKIGFSSLESLLGNLPRGRESKAGTRLPVKFRNPETGETWSGRGRLPKWMMDAEKRGESRKDYLVQN